MYAVTFALTFICFMMSSQRKAHRPFLEESTFCKISANRKSAGSSSVLGSLLNDTCTGNNSTASLQRGQRIVRIVKIKWYRFKWSEWTYTHTHIHLPRDRLEQIDSHPKKPVTRPLEKGTMDAQNKNYFGNDIICTLHADWPKS